MAEMVEAKKIVKLYQQGERNFSQLNLQGMSFQGCDLAGADFSEADLRGVNFRQSRLQGANFAGAKIGLRRRGVILLLLGLLLLAGLLGVGAGLMGTIVNLTIRVYTSRFEEVTAGWAMVVLLIGYAVISMRHGLKAGFSIFLIAFVLSISVAIAGPVIVRLINPLAFSVSFAVANAITIVSTVLGATVAATVLAAGGWAALGIRAGVLTASVFGIGFFATVAATQIVAAIVAVVPCVMLLTGYQCWRALKGDGRHSVIRRMMIAIASQWGTSFEAANLTDANFTGTPLHNVKFDDAILTRTRWTNGVQTEVLRLFVDSFVLLG